MVDFGHSIKIENGVNRKSLGCGTPGFQAPEMITTEGSPEYSYPVDIYALGRTIDTLYTGDSSEIRLVIEKMTALKPEDRGDVDYWCACSMFNAIPSSEFTQSIIPIQEKYTNIFTTKRLHNGQLQLDLCRGDNIDEKVCFSFIKKLQKENNKLKRKRGEEEEEEEEEKKVPENQTKKLKQGISIRITTKY